MSETDEKVKTYGPASIAAAVVAGGTVATLAPLLTVARNFSDPKYSQLQAKLGELKGHGAGSINQASAVAWREFTDRERIANPNAAVVAQHITEQEIAALPEEQRIFFNSAKSAVTTATTAMEHEASHIEKNLKIAAEYNKAEGAAYVFKKSALAFKAGSTGMKVTLGAIVLFAAALGAHIFKRPKPFTENITAERAETLEAVR